MRNSVTESTADAVSTALLRRYGAPQLGDRIRNKRRSLGLTQQDLADRFGVRSQTIGAWENGKRPQRRFFVPIAALLELRGPDEVEALLTALGDGAPHASADDV